MFTNNFLPNLNTLEQTQNQLQGQASSGLNMTLPEDNPLTMGKVLNLQSEVDANTQYQQNITQLTSSATDVSNILSSLQPLIAQASTIAVGAGNLATQGNLPNAASDVGSLVKQILALANSKDAKGNYIFGGTQNDQPPFVATTDADNNITGVTYQGNTSVLSSEIAPNLSMSAQIPGGNTTGTGPQGLLLDSRSGTDVFSHLIALQQNLSSGNLSAITSTDIPAISADDDHVISQMSGNGVVQSALESASNSTTLQGTALSGQISTATSADLAQTLTKLSQTQTAYQAAMQSGVLIMQLSILQYIH
jgi:flagellar hook-associated protein 3 FlgL